MNRLLPQPRPLLDFSGTAREGQYTTYDPTPIPNMQYLQPSIVLQPHQPNVGATQQPLPIASSSQLTITYIQTPRIQRPTEPRTKTRPRPSPRTSPEPPPQPNFQQGGSSSSSGNAPPPQPPQPPQNERPRTRSTRKTYLKEGTTEEQDMASPTLIIPSKIGIQKLREVFEEANNRNTINT